MGRIQILPEDLVNKIAAGEVIERPASVVKELVENAIDAQASKISVEIQSAGRKLIRVTDNGQGMTPEEAKIALKRHSTSKIRELDDLFNLSTLGFRGEALPSIASVSKLSLEPNPSGRGVTARVKDLFYNTPARKKFMKSPATEMGHIGDIVSKYTMANPGIAFELISDGKPLLSSPGSGKLEDAVLAVYGIDLLKELTKVSRDGSIKIHGLVSRPTLTRIDRSYITFFVNGRYVRNFLLNRALEEAYRTLIPGNRYPVGIIFVEINPKHIDVNVHPTKREIKFAKTQEVMDAVRECVAKSLQGVQSPRPNVAGAKDIGLAKEWKPEMADVLFPREDRTLSAVEEINFEVTAVQPLLPVYQHKDTYIICTDGEDLVLIDQHAAHERILYDQLSEQSRVTSRQSLLIPETIELAPKEIVLLQDNIDYLKTLGFELEEFGSNSYILRSVPAVAAKSPARQLLADIISELQNLGKSARLEIKQENIRKTIACKAAVKAGDKLSPPEMSQLIRDLYATQNPLTCPHGRPTMLRFSPAELNQRFGR